MKKLLLPLVAAAALAIPGSALAWGGGHDDHHGGDFRFGGFDALMQLDGTGTSFGSTTATASGSGFTASLATTWSSATSKTFSDDDNDGDNTSGTTMSVSCAPSTASITLTGKSAVSYTGKTCSWTRNGTTKYVFMGSSSDGHRALLGEDGTTVKGAVFGGDSGFHMGEFAAFHSGACDGHH